MVSTGPTADEPMPPAAAATVDMPTTSQGLAIPGTGPDPSAEADAVMVSSGTAPSSAPIPPPSLSPATTTTATPLDKKDASWLVVGDHPYETFRVRFLRYPDYAPIHHRRGPLLPTPSGHKCVPVPMADGTPFAIEFLPESSGHVEVQVNGAEADGYNVPNDTPLRLDGPRSGGRFVFTADLAPTTDAVASPSLPSLSQGLVCINWQPCKRTSASDEPVRLPQPPLLHGVVTGHAWSVSPSSGLKVEHSATLDKTRDDMLTKRHGNDKKDARSSPRDDGRPRPVRTEFTVPTDAGQVTLDRTAVTDCSQLPVRQKYDVCHEVYRARFVLIEKMDHPNVLWVDRNPSDLHNTTLRKEANEIGVDVHVCTTLDSALAWLTEVMPTRSGARLGKTRLREMADFNAAHKTGEHRQYRIMMGYFGEEKKTPATAPMPTTAFFGELGKADPEIAKQAVIPVLIYCGGAYPVASRLANAATGVRVTCRAKVATPFIKMAELSDVDQLQADFGEAPAPTTPGTSSSPSGGQCGVM